MHNIFASQDMAITCIRPHNGPARWGPELSGGCQFSITVLECSSSNNVIGPLNLIDQSAF